MLKVFELYKDKSEYILKYGKVVIHEKYFEGSTEAIEYFKNYITSFSNICSSMDVKFKSAYDNGDIANHKIRRD